MGQNQPKFFLFHLHKLSGCLANLALTTTSAIFIVNSQQAHQITLFTMGHSVGSILPKQQMQVLTYILPKIYQLISIFQLQPIGYS